MITWLNVKNAPKDRAVLFYDTSNNGHPYVVVNWVEDKLQIAGGRWVDSKGLTCNSEFYAELTPPN